MDIVKFLEQLANNVHYGKIIVSSFNEQSEEIKKAFLTNDIQLLKKQFQTDEYLAHSTRVVQA